MALRGVLALVFLTGVCLASDPAAASSSADQDESSEGRLFLLDGTNTSVTVGTSSITSIAVLVLGLLALMALASLLSTPDAPTPYSASASSYAVAPEYGSASVHRSLDEAKAKFE